jgi:hypothetical protein
MGIYFYTVAVSLFIMLFFTGIYLKKKVTGRSFVFDYAIEERRNKGLWKAFSLPVFLFLLALMNGIVAGLLVLASLVLLAILFDMLQSKQPGHKSYLISGSRLIYNGWSVQQFELKELESVNFLPFRDAFEFIFKNSRSLVIPRDLFDGNLLSNFIQRALELSPEKINIDEDAKTKIYL